MAGLLEAMRKKRMLVIATGVVLAAGLGTSAAIWGPEFFAAGQPAKAANAASTTDKTSNTSAKALPAGFSQFLLLAQGTQDSLLIRASELQEPVGPQQLPAARQVTDKLVTSNKTVQMITEPKQIELGGLPGFFYFYSFKDTASGQEGAHSHFFLFNGKTMISMVFQTLPRERFATTAPTFDKIAASFHALKK